MSGRALSIVEAERARGFRNLAGSRLEVTFAVTQYLVDLAVARASTRRNLHGLKVRLRRDGGIGVEIVKPVLGFDARLALVFRVAGPVDVASDPRLYLLVDPSLTWTTVSRLATAAGLAPDGVSIGPASSTREAPTIEKREERGNGRPAGLIMPSFYARPGRPPPLTSLFGCGSLRYDQENLPAPGDRTLR